MKISILVFDDCSAISSLGSYDIFKKANCFARDLGITDNKTALFDIEMVSVRNREVSELDGILLRVHKTISDVDHTDLVVIPGIDNDVVSVIEENSDVFPWLLDQYEQGADIASLCTGAFILAETGLLNKRKATTHWALSDLFTQRYPEVSLRAQNIIVDEGRICSCGGATSFLNLILYLIEKYGGRELALLCSKAFLVDRNNTNQNGYAIFSTQKNHSDSDILKIQEYIDIHYASPLSVKALADLVFTSQRTFMRKFKSATGNSPLEYIQRVRVESAKKQLETSTHPINQIIGNVGYEDLPSFRKLFSRMVGLSMSKYRSRYQISGC